MKNGILWCWNRSRHFSTTTFWTWLYPSFLIPLLSSSLLLLLFLLHLSPSSGTDFLILVCSCSLCDMLGIDWNNSGQVLISGGALFLMLRNSYQLILLIPVASWGSAVSRKYVIDLRCSFFFFLDFSVLLLKFVSFLNIFQYIALLCLLGCRDPTVSEQTSK